MPLTTFQGSPPDRGMLSRNFGLLSVNSKFGGSKGNLSPGNLMLMLSSISRKNMQMRRSASVVLLEAVGIESVNNGLVDFSTLVTQSL